MKTKSFALLAALLALFSIAHAANKHLPPEVPPSLQVPDGYRVSFRAFAIGVQIYTAVPSQSDPTKLVWTLKAPDAVLFDEDGGVIGTHYAYAGPTRPAWESWQGGLVIGSRTVPPVTVDPNAIPWLLLDAIYAQGPGLLKKTMFIQRVNTSGGLAPATPPTQLGEEVRIPYTADYVFYR